MDFTATLAIQTHFVIQNYYIKKTYYFIRIACNKNQYKQTYPQVFLLLIPQRFNWA